MNKSDTDKAPETQPAFSGGPPKPPKKTARELEDVPPRPPRGPTNVLTVSGSWAPLPGWVLYGWLLRFYGIFTLIVVWAGYFFLERTWPAPVKLWFCTAIGVTAILYGIFRRGPSIRNAPPGARRTLSAGEAMGVVIIVVAAGIFLTWVVIGPPH